jgi:hypothetical protein
VLPFSKANVLAVTLVHSTRHHSLQTSTVRYNMLLKSCSLSSQAACLFETETCWDRLLSYYQLVRLIGPMIRGFHLFG